MNSKECESKYSKIKNLWSKKIIPFLIAVKHLLIGTALIGFPTAVSLTPQLYTEHILRLDISITMIMTYSFAFLSYPIFYMLTENKMGKFLQNITWLLVIFNGGFLLLSTIFDNNNSGNYNFAIKLLIISVVMMYFQFVIDEYYKRNPQAQTVQDKLIRQDEKKQEFLNSGIDSYLKQINTEK